MKRRTNEEFLVLAKEKHGGKFEYLDPYISNKDRIRIKCNICKTVTLQQPSTHLTGSGCRVCGSKTTADKNRIAVTTFENKCKKLHGDKYIYHQDYKTTRGKIRITCKRHKKDFIQAAYAHSSKKHGCPLCKNSNGENLILDFLNSNKIKYITQKRFKECRNIKTLPFDFYIESENLCIEFDGIQHFQPVKRFGGLKRFRQTMINDSIKDNFCRENNISLIRISYNQINDIENILKRLFNKN